MQCSGNRGTRRMAIKRDTMPQCLEVSPEVDPISVKSDEYRDSFYQRESVSGDECESGPATMKLTVWHQIFKEIVYSARKCKGLVFRDDTDDNEDHSETKARREEQKHRLQ